MRAASYNAEPLVVVSPTGHIYAQQQHISFIFVGGVVSRKGLGHPKFRSHQLPHLSDNNRRHSAIHHVAVPRAGIRKPSKYPRNTHVSHAKAILPFLAHSPSSRCPSTTLLAYRLFQLPANAESAKLVLRQVPKH
jgi:hypothetical protein